MTKAKAEIGNVLIMGRSIYAASASLGKSTMKRAEARAPPTNWDTTLKSAICRWPGGASVPASRMSPMISVPRPLPPAPGRILTLPPERRLPAGFVHDWNTNASMNQERRKPAGAPPLHPCVVCGGGRCAAPSSILVFVRSLPPVILIRADSRNSRKNRFFRFPVFLCDFVAWLFHPFPAFPFCAFCAFLRPSLLSWWGEPVSACQHFSFQHLFKIRVHPWLVQVQNIGNGDGSIHR